jgi:acetyl-CoA carboxylase biotin carboxylase subunit
VDTHLYAGATIPPYYDSMIAKVVAYGHTREIAIARMERALSETVIEGVQTTVDLCIEILAAPAFRNGRYDVEFLSNELALR